MIKNKWKIIITLVFCVLALILALTIEVEGGNKPGPTPEPIPPKPGPVPVNTGYNLYYLGKDDAVKSSRNKISGYLRFKFVT